MNYGRSRPDAYDSTEATGRVRDLEESQVEKAARIQTAGLEVLNAMTVLQERSVELLTAILSSIEPSSRAGAISMARITEGLGMHIDFDEETVEAYMMAEMRIAAEEAVMWAVRSVTE